MDKREMLKSMLNNLINDKSEEATLDLHNYLTTKMRDVTGLDTAPAASSDSGIDTSVENEVDTSETATDEIE